MQNHDRAVLPIHLMEVGAGVWLVMSPEGRGTKGQTVHTSKNTGDVRENVNVKMLKREGKFSPLKRSLNTQMENGLILIKCTLVHSSTSLFQTYIEALLIF